jgi:hypothetical protein
MCANAQASMQQLKFTDAFTRQNQILSVCAVRDRVIFGSWLSRHFSHYSIDMPAVRPAFHTITFVRSIGAQITWRAPIR